MTTETKGFKVLNTVITVATALIVMFNIVYYAFDAFSYNIDDLPEGEFLYASMSPTAEYVMTTYYIKGSNTLKEGVRCEVTEVATDQKRNIYWQVGVDNAIAGWTANDVININGVSINLSKNDSYDWRYSNAR